jgi:hypothetical protein
MKTAWVLVLVVLAVACVVAKPADEGEFLEDFFNKKFKILLEVKKMKKMMNLKLKLKFF